MEEFPLSVILLIVIIGVYLATYILNNRTKTPEGVETDVGCESCSSFSCSLHSNSKQNN